MNPVQPIIIRHDPSTEVFTAERCYITELDNSVINSFQLPALLLIAALQVHCTECTASESPNPCTINSAHLLRTFHRYSYLTSVAVELISSVANIRIVAMGKYSLCPSACNGINPKR